MGLGVSSEQLPSSNVNSNEVAHIPVNTSSLCRSSSEIAVSVSHCSVAFISSLNQKVQVTSPCYNHSLSNSDPTCPSSSDIDTSLPSLVPRIPPVNASMFHGNIKKLNPINENGVSHPVNEKMLNASQDNPSTSESPTPDHQELAISLPSLYPSNIGRSINIQNSKQSQMQHLSFSQFGESKCIASLSDTEESKQENYKSSSYTFGLTPDPHNHSVPLNLGKNDDSVHASNFKDVHTHSSCSGNSDVTSSKNGMPASGCGHWCSTCHVRVQVEVECVPGSQRSPNGTRRGIRTLSFPKRVRHKVKVPAKEFNATHKKKRNPWSFRLNCRLKANKNYTEPESDIGISALNVGCVSCVCPGYRYPETEPVYQSVNENTNTIPTLDLPQLNSENTSSTDAEENATKIGPRERMARLEASSTFLPLLRESHQSLALPLTYNPVIDLQVLLENSLKFGFTGTRTSWISYPSDGLMRQMNPLASETSLLSRTVHTQVDYIHCLVPDLLAITNCGFYWGKMDRYEAEQLLENRAEGTFLLRDSAQEEYLFSVSFRRYGRSLHARIEQWNHKFSFNSHDPGVFASHTVCGLIEHYKDPSCCMFFEPILTIPLTRTFPFHLQHLCRATICSKITYDGINYLELPKSLKNYLKEYHYKQRVGIRHLD